MAEELDRKHRHLPLEFPGTAGLQPIVWTLHLIAVDQLLKEQAVFVSDTVAVGRNLQGGDGIHKTGGEPPQTAVAEGGVLLLIADLRELKAKFLHRLLDLLEDAEVNYAVAERTPNKKFQRKVIDPFLFLGVEGLLGGDPLLHHQIAHGIGQSLEDIRGPGALRIPPLEAHEMVDHMLLDCLDRGGKGEGLAAVAKNHLRTFHIIKDLHIPHLHWGLIP